MVCDADDICATVKMLHFFLLSLNMSVLRCLTVSVTVSITTSKK